MSVARFTMDSFPRRPMGAQRVAHFLRDGRGSDTCFHRWQIYQKGTDCARKHADVSSLSCRERFLCYYFAFFLLLQIPFWQRCTKRPIAKNCTLKVDSLLVYEP